MSNDEMPDSTKRPINFVYAVIDFLSQFKYAAVFLLLAGVIFLSFPVINFIRARDKMMLCQDNLKNLGTALEMYSTDYCGHYPYKLTSLVPDYVKVLPTCPSAGKETYSENYLKGT